MERALSVGWTKRLLWPAGWRISSVTVTPSEKIWLTRKYWAQSAKQDACVRMSDRGGRTGQADTAALSLLYCATHPMCHLMECFTAFGFVRNAIQKPEPRVYCEVRPWKPARPNVQISRNLILVKLLLIATHLEWVALAADPAACRYVSPVWWVPLLKRECHLKGSTTLTVTVTPVLVGGAWFSCYYC